MEYSASNIKLWSRLGSCGALGQAAMELPGMDDRIVFLTADLCTYSGLDRFKSEYPDRLYNLGIAEQNMIGVAAGMAKEGLIPFATTYATFAAMRCADQVRVNIGYMKLGVKLIGLTAGLSVGILGATHVSIEDIAVMRSIPNVVILSPADSTETVKAVIAAASVDGPVYIRLTGTMPNPVVYNADYNFQIGKAITVKEGKDIAIFATGTMVYNAKQAAEIMGMQGISAKVVDMHTIKPIDEEAIYAACDSKLLVSVEEHSTIGGVGSAIAEKLSRIKGHPPLEMIGLADAYPHAADYAYLIEKSGLMPAQLARSITERYLEVCND